MQSCEKQNTPGAAGTKQVTASSSIITSQISKQVALERLNEDFKNEFSTIRMQQVNGVSRQQFTQWLRNSQVATAEDLYLSSVLSSNGNEYVILRNITIKETGRLASVGLIAVAPKFYNQFTRMVAVINYNIKINETQHICSWKKCDSYEPCPCITWIDLVTGDCPTDKCIVNENCAHFSASDCDGELTGIKTIDVLAAF